MATYVYNKLKKDKLLVQALNFDVELGTSNYELVTVGHSLAAGVAAILSVILRPDFPNVRCYAYSPPSGVVKETCLEDTKSFVISVVVGKDLVPRVGSVQTRLFRRHILEALAACNHSKWRIICGATCCHCVKSPSNPKDLGLAMQSIEALFQKQTSFDQQQSMMSIPGRIIHIIRSHPKPASYSSACATEEPVFQAIWADHYEFNEIIVSPTMISDHSPFVVLDALQKVLTHVSPTKPSRKPMKQQSCSMTPNSSSNVCDQPHSEVNVLQSDLEPEVAGRAITTLTFSQPATSWKKQTNPSDVLELYAAQTKDRPRNFSMLPRQPFIEVRREDLLASAPLASPEVLSETSSLASFGSGGGSIRQAGYQRLMTGAGRMDPIKQSPLCHSLHTRGYSLILEPSEIKEENISGNCNSSNNAHRIIARSSGELSRKFEIPEVQNHRRNKLICPVVIVKSSAEVNPPTGGVETIGCSDNSVQTAQLAEIEIHDQRSNRSVDLFPTELESAEILRIEDSDDAREETLKESSEPDARGFFCEIHVSNDSDRDSIGSNFGRQYLYDGFADHYSPAGRGYPHGFHEFHDKCYSPLTNQRLDVISDLQSAKGCGDHLSSNDSEHRNDTTVAPPGNSMCTERNDLDKCNLILPIPSVLQVENSLRNNLGENK